jgi:putative transposase
MSYSASDKTEIIRLVEQSPLAARRTLERLGIPRSSFYRWYDRNQRGGPEAPGGSPLTARFGLEPYPRGYPQPDCRPGARSTRAQPAGTGGALHGRGKILCLRGLGRSASKGARSHCQPDYIVTKAAEAFKDKTTAPNQLWQTDFTYLKITGWGWCYLSTVLDDFSRFIIASKLCATMKAKDVTATLDLALAAPVSIK